MNLLPTAPSIQAPAVRELPEDLRLCLGPQRLLQCVFDAVHTVAPTSGALEPADGVNPRMLLTLLTYCYGAGIGGSDDIEWAAATDATVRYICAGQSPSRLAIRRFRRENRAAVEACLARILAAVGRCQSERWGDGPDDWAVSDAAPAAGACGEARRRARGKVERAVQLDTSACE